MTQPTGDEPRARRRPAWPGAATDEPERPMTTEQLRADIDSGRTGDKTGGPDPAASPLGTDDEAGGHPNTAEDVALAREHEVQHRDGDTMPNVDHAVGESSDQGLGHTGAGRNPAQAGSELPGYVSSLDATANPANPSRTVSASPGASGGAVERGRLGGTWLWVGGIIVLVAILAAWLS